MSTSNTRKYRPKSGEQKLVALSISYEREHMLRRGMRIEHLRELLIGLAGTLIRGGANLAYAGHWRDCDDNFTYDLLRLISAEREDRTFATATSSPPLGWLYNHLAWPHFLLVTPQTEAQWINSCRIIRISQADAGIAPTYLTSDPPTLTGGDQLALNSAIVLSAMRNLATTGMSVAVPGMPPNQSQIIPRLSARVFLGGKTIGYSGFLPGLFEEALLSLEQSIPMYILGGFGGSAGVLKDALLAMKGTRPVELTLPWHQQTTPQVQKLETLLSNHPDKLPPGMRSTQGLLDALYQRIDNARGSLAVALNTNLTEPETLELMTTIDIRRAVHLCLKALMPDAVPASA